MKTTVTPAHIDAMQRLSDEKRLLRRALIGIVLQAEMQPSKSAAMILAVREASKVIKDTAAR